eukprot:1785824-Pleurochrysis_carterae.AAC.1
MPFQAGRRRGVDHGRARRRAPRDATRGRYHSHQYPEGRRRGAGDCPSLPASSACRWSAPR